MKKQIKFKSYRKVKRTSKVKNVDSEGSEKDTVYRFVKVQPGFIFTLDERRVPSLHRFSRLFPFEHVFYFAISFISFSFGRHRVSMRRMIIFLGGGFRRQFVE